MMGLTRKALRTAALLLAALVASLSPAGAQDAGKDWEPAPPMPDEFDWIQIVSGEWLKGEILVMYDESLEFDSDELDELSFDWGDVKELRSAGPMQARFEDGTILTGKLLIDEGTPFGCWGTRSSPGIATVC